ncbi:MAG: hypothetical protein EAZ30_12865 [Betaproteobacteria bacterium]|nr:MAG: hypothetical protein EAZ30_12865 [Betaproteobacteria bacterium]
MSGGCMCVSQSNDQRVDVTGRLGLKATIIAALLLPSIAMAQPRLVNPVLPDAVYGQPYQTSLTISSSPPPTSISSASIPLGLTLTHFGGSELRIAGVPARAGSFDVGFTATNAGGTTNPTAALTIRRYSQAVSSISVGKEHTCAVVANRIQCWGSGGFGQIGQGFSNSYAPALVTTPNHANQVSAGAFHTCAVIDGGVFCWGRNETSQIGNNSNTNLATAVPIIAVGSGATALSAGRGHTCAVVAGGLKCWGDNAQGQLGVQSGATTFATPQQVLGAGSGVTAVAAGLAHTCAVVGGGVKCWGSGTQGQLGTGNVSQWNAPQQTIAANSGATDIAVGATHSCAVVSGGVQCWGSNVSGELGLGTVSPSLTPANVIAASSGVEAIAAGDSHTCAVVSGGLKCWGLNTKGQLGTYETTQRLLPWSVLPAGSGVSRVGAGGETTCIVINGSAQCVGDDTSGQLGNSRPSDSRRPLPMLSPVLGSTAIASGGSHTCAVASGGVRCWGRNHRGQLGNGQQIDQLSPTQAIPPNSGASGISSYLHHTCAVLDGGVACWGANEHGQLGNGTISDSASPVSAIPAGGGATDVSAGAEHTCAVVSGGVKCWGRNTLGRLGNGLLLDDSAARSTLPVTTIAAGSGATAVSVGVSHTCAVVSGGVKCWGYNEFGEIGYPAGGTFALPYDAIAAGSGVTSVAAGSAFTCVVRSGGVQCWGKHDFGRLGNNNVASTHVPQQVVAVNGGATAVEVGPATACAIVNSGLQCWGLNGNGQLGNGTVTNSLTPVQTIAPGAQVAAVSVGYGVTCAVVDGAIHCLGNNDTGQLGNAVSLPLRPVFSNIPYVPGALSVAINGAGLGSISSAPAGINCPTACSYVAEIGSTIRLSATPAPGAVFMGWTGDCAGDGVCVVSVGAASSATATFVAANKLPVLINPVLPNAVYGQHYSASLMVGGDPRPTTVEISGLPRGLTAVHNGSGSVEISGTPLATGAISLSVSATNLHGTSTAASTFNIVRYSQSVSQLASGDDHSCALLAGGVQCWGDNSRGQLGVGDLADRNFPAEALAAGSGATAIAAGSYQTCAVVNGGVKCWGLFDNNYSSLFGTQYFSNVPVQRIAAASGATAVAVGYWQSCAIVSGGVQCWGYNFDGQLGNGTTVSVGSAPFAQTIRAGSGVTALAVGDGHGCAVITGGLRCWGQNSVGQHGNGTTARSLMPITIFPPNSGVSAVSAGRYHTCAVVNGAPWCWGYNNEGQLGVGTTLNSPTPVQPVGTSSGLGGGPNALSLGASHTCAVLNNGLKCWGANANHQLGNESAAARTVLPVDALAAGTGVTAVASGGRHTCAVVNGGARCWGELALGNTYSTRTGTPTQTMPSSSAVNAVAAGSRHSCAIVDGGVRCWGENGLLQLGGASNSPGERFTQAIPSGSGAQILASRGAHTCVIIDGGLRCWGSNYAGQLGNGSTTNSSTPVQTFPPGSGISAVAVSGEHGCAINNGGLACWGSNQYGKLGDGTTVASLLPLQIIPSGSGVSAVALSDQHTCFVINGGVRCAGMNFHGELGDGSTVSRSTPVAVIGLESGVTAIAAGGYYTCAIASAEMYCWGWALGESSNTPNPLPARVNGAANGVTQMAGGSDHVCVVAAGGLRCWGFNSYGALGVGAQIISSTNPINAIAAGAGVTAVAAGNQYTCAVISGGLHCWGGNDYGQFDDRVNKPNPKLFAAIPFVGHAVTVTRAGTGGGIVFSQPAGIDCAPGCAQQFDVGSSVTLSAVTPPGSVFNGWSGPCSGSGACMLTVNNAINVTATFTLTHAPIATNVSPPSGGGLTCTPNPVPVGGAATCTAVPNAGFALSSISGACNSTGLNATCVIANVTSAQSVTANFIAAPSLTISGHGASVAGASVSLTATLAGANTPSGTVSLRADGVAINGCDALPVVGLSATCSTTSLSAGSKLLTAVFSGDARNASAASPAVAHVVTLAAQSIAFAPQTPNFQPLDIGSTFSINPLAVAGGSSAPVIYTVAPSSVCSISGIVVTMLALGNCDITANQNGDVSHSNANPSTQTVAILATLDVDRSTSQSRYSALTDGLLITRYLKGFEGPALIGGALGATAQRGSASAIKAYLDAIRTRLDVDGDGSYDAGIDGILIVRYLLGLREAALVAGVFPPGTAQRLRTSAQDVEQYLRALVP